MTPELLSAIFAGATFVVIAASAIAALVQLRHLRASNQLAGMLEASRVWNDPTVSAWFTFVRDELPRKLEDPDFLASLLASRVDRTAHIELHVADYFEQIGCYVKYGLIDDRPFLDLASSRIMESWEALWPVTQLRRERSGPVAYENFEYLAVLARDWVRQHPQGAYPARTPRYGAVADTRHRGSSGPTLGAQKLDVSDMKQSR
jgi:hypothetical protein